MSEAKHTPLPWGVERTRICNWIGTLRVDAKIDLLVCGLDREGLKPEAEALSDANADFITRACNSHYELLSALRKLKLEVESAISEQEPSNRLEALDRLFNGHTSTLRMVDAAITKAQPL